jgi:putative transposase
LSYAKPYSPYRGTRNKGWLEFGEHEIALLRKHERTGRPLGEDSFIESLESLSDRDLKPQKPGPKKKDK